MKGCFVVFGVSSKDDPSGIGLKVRNQINSFNNAGMNCSEIVMPIANTKFLSIQYRLPFFNVYPVWFYRDEYQDADYIYMRRPFVMNSHMRKVFKKIKDRNPKCKIIVELPTYPYDAEYATYKAKTLLIWKDKYNRNRMKGLIDRFAILTDEKTIFGIPTVRIRNGIDVTRIKERKPYSSSDGSIHICAVAAFKEWHGYERFIEGIAHYYANGGDRKIVCHFVGEGSELSRYKSLVKQLQVNDHFIFHGYLEGDDLDSIYNISDVSLGSFGMYKINISYSCNLKSREAVARGIPMVTGCPTDIFIKGKYRYYLEFPNDSSVIDIQKIIDFRDSIYQERPEIVVQTIREYARENVTMDSAMRNVFKYINEKEC